MPGNKSTQSAPHRSRSRSRSRSTQSAPNRSRSKSRSRSWSREKLTPVTKSKLNSIGQEPRNVGKLYNYNGLRLKLDKAAVIQYEQYGGPTLISKAVWTIGGDLKIQLV